MCACPCVCAASVSTSMRGILERMRGLCGVLMGRVCICENGLCCGMPKWRVGKWKVASGIQEVLDAIGAQGGLRNGHMLALITRMNQLF